MPKAVTMMMQWACSLELFLFGKWKKLSLDLLYKHTLFPCPFRSKLILFIYLKVSACIRWFILKSLILTLLCFISDLHYFAVMHLALSLFPVLTLQHTSFVLCKCYGTSSPVGGHSHIFQLNTCHVSHIIM